MDHCQAAEAEPTTIFEKKWILQVERKVGVCKLV